MPKIANLRCSKLKAKKTTAQNFLDQNDHEVKQFEREKLVENLKCWWVFFFQQKEEEKK